MRCGQPTPGRSRNSGVPSLELMESAGRAVAEAAAEVATTSRAAIVCGKGNNGGDGLVAAWVLRETGFQVDALLLAPPDQLSKDARAELERLDGARQVDPGELAAAMRGAGVVVDAVFGTGFAGNSPGSSGGGDRCDQRGGCAGGGDRRCLRGERVHGRGRGDGRRRRRHCHLSRAENRPLGRARERSTPESCRWPPIGIPEGAPVEPRAGLIDPRVLELAPSRAAGSTKFSSGQVRDHRRVPRPYRRGLPGGAGRDPDRRGICDGRGPGGPRADLRGEADRGDDAGLREPRRAGSARRPPSRSSAPPSARPASSSAPGMGREQGTQRLIQELTERIEAPLVIDADGLNAHAGRIERLAGRRAPLVLTPHAGEMGRLLDRESERSRRSGSRARGRRQTEAGGSSCSREMTRSSLTGSGSP